MNLEIDIKNKIDSDKFFKVAPFKKDIRKTEPHKHSSYFEIIYLSKGTGRHAIDTQVFSIVSPTIFIVRKEQVHFWDIETEPSGFVVIIKKSFVEETLDKEIKQLLSKISAFTCLYPNDKNTVEILFQLLNKEYHENKDERNAIIEGLLKALLAKLLQSEKLENTISSHKDNLFQKFKDLLSQEKKLTNKVAHYAKLLNTTPQNLNAFCRKESNQSATEVLSEFIIGEAKRLLLYTDETIIEISYSLDFKDNSHFTKYFKRYTGITPNAFRSGSN